MDGMLIHKFINKFKDKFSKQKTTNQEYYEYAFSTKELEDIGKQNKQKIQELKQDIFTKKDDTKNKITTSQVLSKLTTNKEDQLKEEINSTNEKIETEEEILEPTLTEEESINEEPEPTIEEKEPINEIEQEKPSFIKLNKEHQQLVMTKWNEIKPNQIDKDIIDGKDLLNHNYTITYADEATKFIKYIRKEYEIVVCYLIGFNNEKQGIYNKTIFSNQIEDEWKHLNSYIKILEKIRNSKK